MAVRGRRRRGRDRPAGGELALEQVPEPGARRRGAADPAPQRLQDRQSDRARADPGRGARGPAARATATRPGSSRARRPGGDAPAMAATLDAVLDEIASIQRDARAAGATAAAAALADDRAADSQGLDRAKGGGRPADGRHVSRRTRSRCPTSATNPEHLAQLEQWMRCYRPEELFDEPAACSPS